MFLSSTFVPEFLLVTLIWFVLIEKFIKIFILPYFIFLIIFLLGRDGILNFINTRKYTFRFFTFRTLGGRCSFTFTTGSFYWLWLTSTVTTLWIWIAVKDLFYFYCWFDMETPLLCSTIFQSSNTNKYICLPVFEIEYCFWTHVRQPPISFRW